MHVTFRESHGLEETASPFDPAQDPAEMIVLSYSDSDLGAFAAGWKRAGGALPSLRLCNLVGLRHPVSVDTYLDKTVSGAKAVLVRLIGGEAYWPYGLASLQDMARRKGIALAVLPGDGREDPRLDQLSTLPLSTLRRLMALCDAGGAVAAQAALAQLALAAGLYAGPVPGDKRVPESGFYQPGRGVVNEGSPDGVAVVFYRSYLTAADTAPVDALIEGFKAQGLPAYGLFAPSLKGEAAGFVAEALARLTPRAVVNATAFSAKDAGGVSPLDAAGCPVFQVALSTARRRDWATSARGLSPADLAMYVVLPEVDGRLFLGAISFKSPGKRDPDLQFSRFAHRPDPERTQAAIARVMAHLRLTDPGPRRAALILSTYPGRSHQMAHAVGLDALASAEAVLEDLGTPVTGLAAHLAAQTQSWPLSDYVSALESLPKALQDDLNTTWGAPDTDPACQTGAFHFAALRSGQALIALQPERGTPTARVAEYHDLTRTPRHAYVAFYLWLRAQNLHALIHMGAHGTLEWLPGKSVALSDTCWPEALTRDLPVIYPFIVNDPGEAAQAKRRIGAITLGHMPPPMRDAGVPENLQRLERLLDEYSTADGLDPARRLRLIRAIRDEAQGQGVETDLDLPETASPAEAITRIDRFVCDVKDSRFGDGLHIFGRGPQGEAERAGLHAALHGRPVAPGPAGSPDRRSDVLPSGRNLYSVDPRAVPSRAAHAQGVKLAEELIRRHLQDHGDYPRGLVVDLWGSATMRTAGEDFAMALHLAGVAPKWDEGSARVAGFDILPLALLDRPRIDVTLRVSGLFRDIFPGLAQLFESAAAALAARDEAPEFNPYRQTSPRVFAPEPGRYGLGMDEGDFSPEARLAAGEAWLAASSWSINADGTSTQSRTALESRLKTADSFVHSQDLAESDLLLAQDYAAHEAGFAAAMARLGAAKPSLYHLDATRPDRPQARTLSEELARTIRARATNPAWASGMMRHGYRGGAEIAATLDHLAAFAHLAGVVPAHLFDLYHDATLGRPDVRDFLSRENPAALDAMQDVFRRLAEAGLWVTRRNSILLELVP